MKKFLILCLTLCSALILTAQNEGNFGSNLVAEEGAWCWFADPRALHYENEAGSINATYVGYIDVHGNVKATQYDWVKHRKTDVLIRSYFQPDDHNNPTFLVLPDERVMIFYTRHTDELKIWYRVSTKKGDITSLGEEKFLSTANNTTYPSPFILSSDPQHIYLCWRGINWHPTIARLTMPDEQGNCQFDFGPKQIVQSTGARPYAKYASNGKDKIYVSYTTGHPDNEMPDWLYFNVIDINNGNGPILRDLKGKQLSIINNGVFNVNKTDSYASNYPATIIDKSANVRNWVWQIALDKDEHPVIAYPHIDDAKTSHVYWYARWNGTAWKNTKVASAGHAFHQNWNQTERCYSGGMTLDPDHINDMYLSIPTKNGQFNKDGIYEIWKYTIDDEGNVAGSEQMTKDSPKNNARPYVIPGSKNSPMRVGWMQGDYYYWMVNKNYPLGYPTQIMCDYWWNEELTSEEETNPRTDCICIGVGKTVCVGISMDASKYAGTLFKAGNMTYAIDDDNYPVVTIGNNSYKSQNRLLTSDNWAFNSTGTSGDNHPTKLSTWVLTMTYDGHVLTLYRNGFVDQVIETDELAGGVPSTSDLNTAHTIIHMFDYYAVASPVTVQSMVKQMQYEMKVQHNQNLPKELQNGDFEGAYAPMKNSGVTSDRAIYVPEGWTVEYTNRNENDLSALKTGDYYFDRFFGALAKPSADSQQTYWVRQNWGTSTIALTQELLLPEGEYTLIAQVWKSGLGGDAYLQAVTQDGPTASAPTVENKEAWQQMTVNFQSDGVSSTTIRLVAMHNNNGTEKIIGFDHVTLEKHITDAVRHPFPEKQSTRIYDLQGRRVSGNAKSGIFVGKGQKHIRASGFAE
ncbi:BNR repeat-containing protein [Prevotella sp. E2-28]|uniref:BNR repeat-containing protein n=1 Tax=Prevotella sp. E2-28 TaxID=2913620 RepID=UPI001EDC0EF9|nr:BNR repeat-containing protein [Prevotella sp. E2-28]UKK54242.1 BNR repeat-containing protein [Prevotella sp. E2-28]